MKTKFSVDYIYEHLIAYDYFTEEELDLVTNVAGYNRETLDNCIYSRYGYNDFEQLLEEDENLNLDK